VQDQYPIYALLHDFSLICHRSRLLSHLPYHHFGVRAAARCPRWALALVILLAAESRACAGGDEAQGQGPTLGSLGLRKRVGADLAYPRERTKPDPARRTAGFL